MYYYYIYSMYNIYKGYTNIMYKGIFKKLEIVLKDN